MPRFGQKSRENLLQCDYRLQILFNTVVVNFDCSVLCGHRNEEDQNQAFSTNHSKLKWPESAHNSLPSKAIDVVPYPINWENLDRFYYFGGFVKGIAKELELDIIWGGDFDDDTFLKDGRFMDLPHYSIKD